MTRFAALLLTLAFAGTAVAADPPPAKLPDPTFPDTVSQEVLVPMDDGVQIALTVTLPSQDGSTAAPGRFPVVLAMTPYGRNGMCGCPSAATFATRGIAMAVADVRGTGGSGGDLSQNYFSPREARDGAAIIEWLGTRDWSTGKVGMAGGSYVGITQLLAAEQQPEHLAAITPQVPIADLYRDGYTHGGIPNLFFDAQYIGVQGGPGYVGPNTDPALLQATLQHKLGQSPPGMIAFDYLARPNDDDFYRDRSPIYHADRIKVPVLVLSSWRDGLLRGATEMFDALKGRRGVETRLYVDPCTHKGCGAPFAPLTDPPGRQDLNALIFEFLDAHLRGTAVPRRPRVDLYVQGRNSYLADEQWPPAGTRFEELPLGEGKATYVTNPLAGFSLAFNRYGTVAASPYVPLDQRLEGPQGVTVRSEPFAKPRLLAGSLALHLVAASTAPDTDWYAKVSDVAPDGTETFVTEGALRASHRALDPAKSRPERPYHTHTDPQPIEPGKFYEYEVEIWPTAYELAEGHRLQLRITSTDLPTHLPGSIHLDAASPQDTRIELNQPAQNTVDLAASRLILPAPAASQAAKDAPAPTAGASLAPVADRPACRRPAARRIRLRSGALRVVVRRAGEPVRGATVIARGDGRARRAKTGRAGRATLKLRPGRYRVATRACGARLIVRG